VPTTLVSFEPEIILKNGLSRNKKHNESRGVKLLLSVPWAPNLLEEVDFKECGSGGWHGTRFASFALIWRINGNFPANKMSPSMTSAGCKGNSMSYIRHIWISNPVRLCSDKTIQGVSVWA
jgi:hypothetical protein